MWIWGLQPRALAVIEIWTTARSDVVSVQTRRKVLGSAARVYLLAEEIYCFLPLAGESSNTTPPLRLPSTEADPYKSPVASRSKPPAGPEPFSPSNVRSVVSFHFPLACGESRNTMPIPKRPSLAFP